MTKSMTAYGRGESSHHDTRFVAEIKSVNNRHRDVVLRMPKALQIVEDEIRALVAARIQRGRIEVFLQMEKKGEGSEYELELNLPLVKSYMAVIRELNETCGLEKEVSTDYICQLRDVIQIKTQDLDIEGLKPGISEALNLALDSHETMRMKEGTVIEKDFLERIQGIEGRLDEIEKRAPHVVEEYIKRLRKKISHISTEIEIDENRLAQEVAIFSDRCDITEEVVRAKSHLSQFRHYVGMDEAIGRRLDFLIQEIHREVNTMSAKASDSSISTEVVEIKGELEKIREQIQNVE
ncbi:MAG: YicC family protein [Deltaproteobacteria bacterium]|nr:YicC family protein [Deltaproteobacteria bacterium]MBW2208152.1 YicC family protein [Deltaproteobacteria bacterium]